MNHSYTLLTIVTRNPIYGVTYNLKGGFGGTSSDVSAEWVVTKSYRTQGEERGRKLKCLSLDI